MERSEEKKDHGQWSIVHGRNEEKSRWSMVNSPWKGVKKEVDGQWSMVGNEGKSPWSMVHSPW